MKPGVASWSRPEALNALQWLIEAGEDIAVGDTPRSWLETAPMAAPVPNHEDRAPAPDFPADSRPFEAVATPLPDAAPASRDIIVEGNSEASAALIMSVSATAGKNRILGEDEQLLLRRMLQAIGFDVDQLIRIGLPEGARADAIKAAVAGSSARTLMLLGDAPSKAVFGEPVARSRLKTQHLEINGQDIPVVATFAPGYLIQQPRQKALAWADLQRFAGTMPS